MLYINVGNHKDEGDHRKKVVDHEIRDAIENMADRRREGCCSKCG